MVTFGDVDEFNESKLFLKKREDRLEMETDPPLERVLWLIRA